MKRAKIARPLDREEWLEDRRAYVGASECAALFGEHPWISLGDLWAMKVERKEQTENRAMVRGRVLEDAVARWYAEEYGVELDEPTVLYVVGPADDELGVLCATLDRLVVGIRTALEVKTSASYVSELPRYWYWQAQAQLLATGFERVRFAVLDASLDLQSFAVEPNEADQAELLRRATDFLGYVRAKERPPDAFLSRAMVERLYPDPKPIAVELNPERVRSMIARLALARRRIREYEADANALAAMVLYELGDATDGTIDGELVVTARVVHANDLDTKRLRAEHPELVREYAKPRTYRKVLLK